MTKPQEVKTNPSSLNVHRTRLSELLATSHGRFITVTFIKVNGETRVLTGRFGVKHELKGKTNKAAAGWDKPYKTIWDARKKAYRMINLSTILLVHMQGKHYTVID